ncbi:MAG: ABC transporter permease subunit [Anaerolineae bacterium]|nr:ABC transporter permease subunit [Anaerolineae bacterium]
MTVYNDPIENRPPPKRRRAYQIFTPGIPFYRDVRVLRLVAQIVFAVLFIGTLAVTWISLTTNLEQSQIALDFGVYKRSFAAGLPEGIPFDTEWDWAGNLDLANSTIFPVWIVLWLGIAYYAYTRLRQRNRQLAIIAAAVIVLLIPLHPTIISELDKAVSPYLFPKSNTRAIISGIVNTLRVVVLSVFASTLLGVLIGIGLLSTNYLVRTVSHVYVEIFRNTPLLVQLVLIYQGALLILPIVANSMTSPDKIGPLRFYEKFYVVNVRAFSFPKLNPTDTAAWFYGGLIVGLIAGYLVRRWRIRVQELTGTPSRTWLFVIPLFIVCMITGWLIAGGWPLSSGPFNVEYPQFGRFNIEGGTQISTPFMSLFSALTLYTTAFIADIVRAGIQSVPKGQVEAARSLGLSGPQVLGMVVLPQALRLIIPPLGNQYVNIGKNSSLGLAVGYADTYQAVQLVNNESGQSVPLFVGMMIIYLALSLLFSLLTNLLNTTTRLRTR